MAHDKHTVEQIIKAVESETHGVYGRNEMYNDMKILVQQLKYANRVNVELSKRLEKLSK